ncbi:MAG: NAD(P)/FAD-dependent oxidoreductase [Planctomycetaceae bacterium]|jgi:menaquinone-9 beta-reductase|nr:NAD(P)/FAD-dependent oxidoreductase [Planctomycetaceae bacterium]MBT6486488.1 NAD(P)/FAD-dependent oxidoreductase [Planctomycetaceae bacterium]MBT6495811.1 NAD(P)/FAD-dependent oxidoreductase [Planctomycetaceae bacterium]
MKLAATIDANTAAAKPWDAIVVGAGPAGSIAARQLSLSGLRTLLVERKAFPRNKVCGACINGRAVAALHLLGLDGVLDRLSPIPLTRFHVRCGSGRGEILLPAGVAVSRAVFDTELAAAAIAAGAEFLPETSATLLGDAPTQPVRAVQLLQQEKDVTTIVARVVLLADGLSNSSLPQDHELRGHVAPHSRIGVGGVVEHCPPGFENGTIYMAVGKVGYVGLVRVEAGRLNVAAALDPVALGRDERPATAIASLLASSRFPGVASIESTAWTGTVPLTRSSPNPAGRRVLMLGDAAGYVEPFTGEGIASALTNGTAAATLVARNISAWNEDVERQWVLQHRQLFDDRQRWCRRLARLLWHPWAVRGVLRGLSIAPWLARPIVNRLNQTPAGISNCDATDRSDIRHNLIPVNEAPEFSQ